MNDTFNGMTEFSIVSFTEEELGKLKERKGMELVKVGKYSKDKISTYLGTAAFIPSLTAAMVHSALGSMEPEATGIVLEYLAANRRTYVRGLMIDGMSRIPASLLTVEKRAVWSAFTGLSTEAASVFIGAVVAVRVEDYAIAAGLQALGMNRAKYDASLEAMDSETGLMPDLHYSEEELGKLLDLAETKKPAFFKAFSNDSTQKFLLSLVLEGRILTRYKTFSNDMCKQGINMLRGITDPVALAVTKMLRDRMEDIAKQTSLVGMDQETMAIMNAQLSQAV